MPIDDFERESLHMPSPSSCAVEQPPPCSERIQEGDVVLNRQLEANDAEQLAKNMPRVQPPLASPPKRVGVLISGCGSNLQALIEAQRDPLRGLHIEIVCVLSNWPTAPGLEIAKSAGIPTHVVSHRDYDTRETFDAALTAHLEAYDVELVCLTKFRRILQPGFVRRWSGRLLNVHPSLLPAFPGLRAQRQALEAGARVSGCTVHFVDEGVDTGRVILQREVRLAEGGGETEETLTAKILVAERWALVAALRLVMTGAVRNE